MDWACGPVRGQDRKYNIQVNAEQHNNPKGNCVVA